MITKKDLQEAIDKCQNAKRPDAQTCMMLASFYTILDHIEGQSQEGKYSYQAEPDTADEVIYYKGSTEFSALVDGKDPSRVWPIMNELMEAVKVLHPKLYQATIRKLDF